jgi:hypothetical protein
MGGFPRPKRGGKSGARRGATVRKTVQLYDYLFPFMNSLELVGCAGSAHYVDHSFNIIQYSAKRSRTNAMKKTATIP